MTPRDRADIEALAAKVIAENHAVLIVTVRTVMLTPLDQPDRAWCVDCLKPSRLAWQVAFEAGTDFDVRTVSVCTDCGEEVWL